MTNDAVTVVFLVFAEQKSGAITIEGCFPDDRSSAEDLARSRSGWVAPMKPGAYPEGNAGPIPGAYCPEFIAEADEFDSRVGELINDIRTSPYELDGKGSVTIKVRATVFERLISLKGFD